MRPEDDPKAESLLQGKDARDITYPKRLMPNYDERVVGGRDRNTTRVGCRFPASRCPSQSGGVPAGPALDTFSVPVIPDQFGNVTVTPASPFSLQSDTTYRIAVTGLTGDFNWGGSSPPVTPTGIATSEGYLGGASLPPTIPQGGPTSRPHFESMELSFPLPAFPNRHPYCWAPSAWRCP
jgi:hypothetical protein